MHGIVVNLFPAPQMRVSVGLGSFLRLFVFLIRPFQVSQQIEPKRIEEDVDFYMKKIEKADSEKYFDYMWSVRSGACSLVYDRLFVA